MTYRTSSFFKNYKKCPLDIFDSYRNEGKIGERMNEAVDDLSEYILRLGNKLHYYGHYNQVIRKVI